MFEKIKDACPNVVDDDFVPAIVGGNEKIVIVKTDDNKWEITKWEVSDPQPTIDNLEQLEE
jgi:hypothetical protein